MLFTGPREQITYGSNQDRRQRNLSVIALPRNHFYRTRERIRYSRLLRGGFRVLGLGRHRHHARDLANELDGEARALGLHRDLLDEPAQDLKRLGARRGVGERLPQVGHLLAVELGQIGMQPRRRGRGGSDDLLERRLALAQLVQTSLEPRRAQAISNRFNEAVELAADVLSLSQIPWRGELGRGER